MRPFSRRLFITSTLATAGSALAPRSESGRAFAAAPSPPAADLVRLLKASPQVRLARVASHQCTWARIGARQRIVTIHSLIDEEILYQRSSEPSAVKEIITLGGEVGRLAQKVSGEAQLVDGQRGVFFLGPVTQLGTLLTGGAAGHFRLSPEAHERLLADTQSHRKQASLDGMPLKQFKRLLKEYK